MHFFRNVTETIVQLLFKGLNRKIEALYSQERPWASIPYEMALEISMKTYLIPILRAYFQGWGFSCRKHASNELHCLTLNSWVFSKAIATLVWRVYTWFALNSFCLPFYIEMMQLSEIQFIWKLLAITVNYPRQDIAQCL